MIVQDIHTFQRYIPTAAFVQSFSLLEDALMTAEDWMIKNIVSENVLDEIQQDPYAMSYLTRAICTTAFCEIIPTADLVLTESGFAVASSEQYAPASKHRVDSLLSNTRKRSMYAIDELVSYLIRKNEEWKGTEQFAHLTSAFIPTIEDFEKHGGKMEENTDWTDFLRKIPQMRNWIQEKLYPFLSAKYIDELLEKVRDNEKLIIPEEKQVLDYMRDSISMGISGNESAAVKKVANALSIMRGAPDKFETWAASEEAKGYTPDRSKSNIYSML